MTKDSIWRIKRDMSDKTSQIKQAVEFQDFKDRRKTPRFDPSVIPFLETVYLVGGPEVKLVNISRGGALIESWERFSPGLSIMLKITTAETLYYLKGRVLRYDVSSIDDTVPHYYSAIAFEEDFTFLPERTDWLNTGFNGPLSAVSAHLLFTRTFLQQQRNPHVKFNLRYPNKCLEECMNKPHALGIP
jgi:hypothetical protein